MKITFTILLTIVISSAFGQDTSKGKFKGRVDFKETRQLQVNIDNSDPTTQQLLSQLPKSRTSEKQLLFSDNKSLYSNKKAEPEEEQITQDGDQTVIMKFEEPESNIFYDAAEDQLVQQRDFMGRTFLIKGSDKAIKWKLSGEVKEILGYQCQKAFRDDTLQTVAWYAPELAAFTGPGTYNGLPGLILEVDIPGIKTNIVATSISLDIEEPEISAPTKGKKVNRKQFQKIMQERIKEMQQEFGGSGNIIIRTERQD